MLTRRIRFSIIVLVILLFMASTLPGIRVAAYTNLGMIALTELANISTGDEAKAEEAKFWFQSALSLHHNAARAIYGLALVSWRSGDPEIGQHLFELYSENHPQDVIAKLFLGDIAYEAGDINTAIRLWSSLPLGMLFAWRAKGFLAAKDMESAKTALDVSQKVGPSSYDLEYRLAEQYTALAAQYRNAGDKENEALACTNGSDAYRRALTFRPIYTFVRIRHGILLRDCGRYDEALTELRNVDATSQPSAIAWEQQEIGVTYQILGDLTTAIEHYERAVELQPANGMYRILLGRARAKAGAPLLALSDFQTVIDTTQNDAWLGWAHSERGNVYLTLGELNKARQAYESATTIQPDRGDYRILLGVVLVQAGETDAARLQFQQVLSSNNPEWRAWAQRELDKLK